MKIKFFSFLFLFSTAFFNSFDAVDLTVVGVVVSADGLGRIPIDFIDLFKDDLSINCIPTEYRKGGISRKVKKIILNPDKTPGNVCVYCAPLWWAHSPNMHTLVPAESKIKIAYSMLESSSIPPEWVQILNSTFDAVVVPDQFLVDVYKNSGVMIPIFELPLGMFLHKYHAKSKCSRPSIPFVFGTTVSCDERKNYTMLIESFAEEFGNSEDVILKLNSRYGNHRAYKNLIERLGVNNIFFTHSILSKKSYIGFLNSFDCFINISKGEGFSLCPREALALGIPCIITKNSAQTTICNSGFVRAVPAEIPEPANYGRLFNKQLIGYFFNPSKEDVKAALRDVYDHYELYQQKAKEGSRWVKQYAWKNLKSKYRNLFKPKNVMLGNQNIITNKYLMTSSPELYSKYKNLIDEEFVANKEVSEK